MKPVREPEGIVIHRNRQGVLQISCENNMLRLIDLMMTCAGSFLHRFSFRLIICNFFTYHLDTNT